MFRPKVSIFVWVWVVSVLSFQAPGNFGWEIPKQGKISFAKHKLPYTPFPACNARKFTAGKSATKKQLDGRLANSNNNTNSFKTKFH